MEGVADGVFECIKITGIDLNSFFLCTPTICTVYAMTGNSFGIGGPRKGILNIDANSTDHVNCTKSATRQSPNNDASDNHAYAIAKEAGTPMSGMLTRDLSMKGR